jgi:hypothetical protein
VPISSSLENENVARSEIADLQVDPEDVDVMSRLVTGSFEGHVAGDLSHLLRPDPGSVGPRGYRRAVRQPVSPEVLDLITGWVTSRRGPAPGSRRVGAGTARLVSAALRLRTREI